MALGGGPLLAGQQQTAEMFSGAGAYQRFMGRWSEMLAPLLVDFARPPDAGRVLDVGSGTGALAFAVAARRPRCQVLGIDPSPEYVGFARQRNRFPGRASFEVGDAQRLRFADAAFTSSLSLLVFNFIPDHTKALLEPGKNNFHVCAGSCPLSFRRYVWRVGRDCDSRRPDLDSGLLVQRAARIE